MTRAAIYARISLDRRDGEGVDRQLSDCKQLCGERGWEPVEYIDNDVSAFRAMRRPAWDRLIDDLHAGQITAVVAWHPDRLYRRLADLEVFIDAVTAASAEVATVKAGDVDLSNASGRMIARILGSVSRHESERIGERVARAKADRAASGLPAGGGRRPYGLTARRDALVPDEAGMLRDVAERILAGHSYASVVRDLDAAAVRSSTGRPWTVGTLRRTLTSPHVAGLRAYKGAVTGEASWPAILDRDTWEQLCADHATRRWTEARRGTALLSGLLVCFRCGSPLHISRTRRATTYRCWATQRTNGRGCGKLSLTAGPAEQLVTDTVEAWLSDPAMLAAAASLASAPAVDTDTAEIDRRLTVLATRWAEGELSDDEHRAARAVLVQRRAEHPTRRHHPVDVRLLAGRWDDLAVPQRRALIATFLAPIEVQAGRDGDTLRPLADRLDLRPIWER